MSSPMPVSKRLVVVGLAAVFAACASAQSLPNPQGGEEGLSGPLPGDQTHPALSLGSSGGYAVWQDNAIDSAGLGIGARRLDANGSPVGAAFRVNEVAANDQENPQVATLQDGGAAFVWQANRAGFRDVYARFMAPSGAFRTKDLLLSEPQFNVNRRFTTNWVVVRNNRTITRRFRISQVAQHRLDLSANPVVTALADGNVAIAYASHWRFVTNEPVALPRVKRFGTRYITNSVLVASGRSLDLKQDIYVQRFTPGGLRLGDEVRVNPVTASNQRDPAIAALDNGGFVVAWVTEQRQALPSFSGGFTVDALINIPDVHVRLFDAAGQAVSGEFRVSPGAVSASPVVAPLEKGGFRVAWAQRAAATRDGWDIYTCAFDRNGQALSGAVRVNNSAFGDQFAPRIASSAWGEMIVWTSLGHQRARVDAMLANLPNLSNEERGELGVLNLSWQDIFGRWMSGNAFAGDDFQINTTIYGRQTQPSVAIGPAGSIVVGWVSQQGNAAVDVMGQRYSAGPQ